MIGDIRRNLSSTGTNATNKTQQSLRAEVTQGQNKYRMRLLGREFFFTVETGRKPTPEKKPSRTMIQNIREWVKARGLEERLTWAIATEIQKKGTRLWRQGGRKDIVSNVVTNSRIDQITRSVLDQFAKDFAANIKNIFK